MPPVDVIRDAAVLRAQQEARARVELLALELAQTLAVVEASLRHDAHIVEPGEYAPRTVVDCPGQREARSFLRSVRYAAETALQVRAGLSP